MGAITGASPGYQDQAGEEDHQRASGIEIARDGARDHQSSRTGQALDEAKHHKDRCSGRQSARNGSEQKAHQPDDQRAPPAQPIR
jgi:hypothetical protein